MERYVLGGRVFVPMGEGTVEYDYHAMACLQRAGLDDLPVEPGEDLGAYADRLVRHVIRTGQILPLLGCLLAPEPDPGGSDRPPGEAWTPELARETATFLRSVTDPKDKDTLRRITAGLVADFFVSGLASLRTSATSSVGEESPKKPEPETAGTVPGPS